MAGELALCAPKLPVHVEYTITKKVPKNFSEGLPFGEVVKVGFEHILDIFGVSCHDGSSCTKAVHYNCVGS